jgi:rhamnogalacturonyl hydrolase YesR
VSCLWGVALGKAVATGIATFAGYKAAEKTYQAIKKAVENKAVA